MLSQGSRGSAFASDTSVSVPGPLHPHSQSWPNGTLDYPSGSRREGSLCLSASGPLHLRGKVDGPSRGLTLLFLVLTPGVSIPQVLQTPSCVTLRHCPAGAVLLGLRREEHGMIMAKDFIPESQPCQSHGSQVSCSEFKVAVPPLPLLWGDPLPRWECLVGPQVLRGHS